MATKLIARVLAPIDTTAGRIDINSLVSASKTKIDELLENHLVSTNQGDIDFCAQELGAKPIEIE